MITSMNYVWWEIWTQKIYEKTTIASNVFSQGKKWNKEKSLLELCTWTLIAIKKISTENCCSYSFSEKPALFIWFSKHDSHIPITSPVFKNILISIVHGDFPSIFYHLALKKRFTVSERKTKIANTQNLNNCFDFHVCLSIRPSVRPFVCLSVCPKTSSISCSCITKCH